MAYQGFFKPQNPQKYRGNPTNIIYRSGWELKVMQRFDTDSNVIWWGSEETVIPYRSPVDGRPHRYFVDFTAKIRTATGECKTVLIEIKPFAQTQEPKRQPKPTKRYINEVMTYGVNQAKWQAANKYCKERGYEFMILTERELGIKF